jgi:hypothetical protein
MNKIMIKSNFFLKYKFLIAILFGSVLYLSGQASLRMQGSLQKPSGKPFDNGFHSITFKLYEVEVGGQAIWTEVQPRVQVENGLYEASLGSIVPLNLSFNKRYYLGASVNGGAELAPRAILGNSPYATSVTGKDNVFPTSGTVGVGTRVPDTLAYALQLSNVNRTGTLFIDGGQRSELILKKASNSASGSISFDSSMISIRNLDISIQNNLELPAGATVKYNGLSDWRLIGRDEFLSVNHGWVCHEDWFNTINKSIQRGIPNTPFSKSNILRPSQHGNDVLKKGFNLTNIPHTMIKVVFTYHFLDSWDADETGWAAFSNSQNPYVADGRQDGNFYVAWYNQSPLKFSPDGFSRDPGYFGSASGTDAGVQGEMIAWHTTNNFWLFFGSTLDGDSNDESYGISNIEIWVR